MVNMLLETPEAERFLWVNSGEPHCMRRRMILAKYGPQVRKLYGYDHSTAWQVIFVTLLQVYMAWLVKDWSWGWIALASYVVSATANQNLFTAQHEISHFLAFKRPSLNKALAYFSNTVLVVPVCVKFREYHHDHHIFLGIDGGDVDLPTVFEARLVGLGAAAANGSHDMGGSAEGKPPAERRAGEGTYPLGARALALITKTLWGLTYLIAYGVRPLLVRPKPPTRADLVNWVTTGGFDLAVLYLFGFKSIVYLLAGSLLGGSLLHPMGGHLLAEHYLFEPGQETYSYYGPMNRLMYNVGLHNEHHDFPQIPHTRLKHLREIAPEFYLPMYQHYSYCWVLWRFFADPTIGPWTRIHRLERKGDAKQNASLLSALGTYALWRGAPVPSAARAAGLWDGTVDGSDRAKANARAREAARAFADSDAAGQAAAFDVRRPAAPRGPASPPEGSRDAAPPAAAAKETLLGAEAPATPRAVALSADGTSKRLSHARLTSVVEGAPLPHAVAAA